MTGPREFDTIWQLAEPNQYRIRRFSRQSVLITKLELMGLCTAGDFSYKVTIPPEDLVMLKLQLNIRIETDWTCK